MLNTQPEQWVLWAGLLVAQNFAFTFVSRARNSGSLTRHVWAALLSNGVWFVSQILVFSQMLKIITGEYGWAAAAGVGLFYTTFTIVGSVAAHYVALRTETARSAVGASRKYAQIPVEEWERVKQLTLGGNA